MTDTIARTVGIDICKSRLDVHLLPDGIDRQFANAATGPRELMRSLGPVGPSKLIAAPNEPARRFDILTSIPGLGEATAFAIIADMPELETLANKQAASLTGLAPIDRQSGQWKGKSFIQGGQSVAQASALYAALVAIRFNHTFKAKYESLRAAGKPAKVAITPSCESSSC